MIQSPSGFRHEALLYRGGATGLAQAVEADVEHTLEAGGTVVVATPPDRLDAIRDRVGAHERLELLDMTALGGNPARIIPIWRDLTDAVRSPFLGIGEPVWTGRDPDVLTECHRHEALINVAFADDPEWRLVCPYDADGLDPAVLADAGRTHPVVHAPDGRFRRAPVDGEGAFHALGTPLAAPPADATTVAFGVDGLDALRLLAARHADAAGLTERRRDDLLLAVTEAAANSVVHGGGDGRFSIWTAGTAVVCQCEDAGRIRDPLVGRRRPTLDQPDGRGFWLMHQLCDLVQVRDTACGTTVRLTLR